MKHKKMLDELQVGDWVQVIDTNYRGKIEKLNIKHAQVNIGTWRCKFPKERLKRIDQPQPDRSSIRNPTLPINHITKTSFFRSEIDLHGMTVKESLEALTYFIDQAILHRQDQIKIIHGKGTGTLFYAINEYLKKHPQVRKAIQKPYLPGCWGVTWAYL